MAFSQAQIDAYVANNGNGCIRCESKNVYGFGGFVVTPEDITRNIQCEECGEIWTDVYHVVGVREVESK